MPKTLYHASRHSFSEVDAGKLGTGQNLHGRGFYTSPSPIDCIYFITEDGALNFNDGKNAVDAAIYAFDLDDDAQILEPDQPISSALAANFKVIGEKIGKPDLGQRMAESKTVNNDFRYMASLGDGMKILQMAGVDALFKDGYYCVVNTARIGNLRLYDASGAMAAQQNAEIQKALDNVSATDQKFEVLVTTQPKVSTTYQNICEAVAGIAATLGRDAHVQHLQTVLKYFLVEEVEEKPDPQKNILPLNRFLSEARSKLGLYEDAPMMRVTALVNSAVADIHTRAAPAVESVKHVEDSKFTARTSVAAVPENLEGPYTVDNLFPDEKKPRGIVFPDSADEKLFKSAENLVSILNKMHQENGSVPSDLRNVIVQNTARLASPPDSPHYNHDWQKGNLSWMGNVRDQVNGAGYLHSQIKMLEMGLPHSVSQETAVALRSFVDVFAKTKGASAYTALALAAEAPDDDAIVAKLNNAAGKPVAAKPAGQKF